MDPTLLAVVSASILAFGLVSRRLEKSPITPPMVFVALGAMLSGAGLDLVDFTRLGQGIHVVAELTLVLVLFTDASRIDLQCLRREGNLPIRLLAFGLPLTVLGGALVAAWVFPGLEALEALLLAAILAPTDAALGQAVVSSQSVPLRIRQALNVESGLNDGIALPIVLVLAALAGAIENDAGVGAWLRFAALQVTLGPLVGAAVGFGGGRLLDRALRAGSIDGAFQRISALGLALLAFAGAQLVGGNGFIAAFVAGITLGNTARGVCGCLFDFGEAEGQLLTLLVFLLFGGALVPQALAHADARALGFAVLSLTAVRMLPVALSLLGSGLQPVSLAFLGWFGPRGLASILFVLLVVEEDRLASGAILHAVVVVTVLLSTFAHGITAYPLARRYGDSISLRRERAAAEHAAVPDLPVRVRHGRATGTA